jgi:APA family basic amino acid/polyamine antiporter
LAFTASGDIAFVAGATNFAVFVGFAAVNVSLIVLRYTMPDVPRAFKIPFSIGRLPLVPVLSLAAIAFLMANLERDVLLFGGLLFFSGVVAMEVLSLWRPRDETGGG